ncbi:hypothetical protein MESS4_120008 [Mesorhizobium sp. STM 4661]|nr:hypothetical protein MESS4_120008 [Mesorhizobium sp. STM 4661]
MRERHLQEFDERARRLAILGDHGQRAGAEHRRAEFWLGGVRREVEEVRILADFGPFREEGRDERRLVMQIAFRRHREEALRAVAEVGRGDRLGTTVDHLVVGRDLAENVDGVDHRGIVERDFVLHPFVVGLGRLGAQHDVFHPVGRRPACGAARTEPDAPRRAAVGDDLLFELGQLFLRLRHRVAGFLEIVRRVPDQRLHVGLVGEGEEARLAVLVLEGSEIDPGLAGAVIVLHPIGGVVAKRRQQALRGQVLDQARLRQHGDVGRAAGLRVDDDLLFVILRGGIFELDAGRFREIVENAAHQALVLAAPRPEDRQRLALEVDLLELFVIRPVEAGVFARLEFQFGLRRCAQGERGKRGAQQKHFLHRYFLPVVTNTGRNLHSARRRCGTVTQSEGNRNLPQSLSKRFGLSDLATESTGSQEGRQANRFDFCDEEHKMCAATCFFGGAAEIFAANRFQHCLWLSDAGSAAFIAGGIQN